MSKELRETLLQLLRLGIGQTDSADISHTVGLAVLKALAEKQGLSAIVVEGLNKLDTNQANFAGMSQAQRLKWIGDVFQNYEQRYKRYVKAIGALAAWHRDHGLNMMVLKGYACSLDWPRPDHRPCGDIDIWLFGQQKVADALIANERGIRVDDSHPHHTVFSWQGFMVENHYDFVNVHHHRSNMEMERILKELGADDSCFTEVDGARVYLPSPNLGALFLLRHAMAHFAASELNLRQLLDWAFFVQKHGADVDWTWLDGVLVEFGMKEAFVVFNAICVEDLGFDAALFPAYRVDPGVKERVLAEILSPEFAEAMPSALVPRAWWKFRRWRANAWKHRLCYRESLWSAFWGGVWGHLLKPGTI